MRVQESIVAALLPAAAVAKAFTPASTSQSDSLAAIALRNVIRRHEDGTYSPSVSRLPRTDQKPHPPPSYGASNQTCTLENARVRREWDTFTAKEKRAYIDAVLCILEKPSISGDAVPGARSRYDDFLGTHINQTLSIHGTGNFFAWHRYFVWTYEEALRNECGYKGDLPYLNWGRYAHDLHNAPVFDGSDTSMSGDGAYVPHNATNIPSDAQPDIVLPPGQGGGCVTSGPFVNMTVRLGPVAPAITYAPKNPSPNGLGFNPRCLRRDLSPYAAQKWATDQNVTDCIAQSPTYLSFLRTLSGDFPNGFLGIHTAGHFFVGSDPGGDLFASPGDPYFFLQHAQIDRVWWIWQNQCPSEERVYAIGGTITVNDTPPSRNTTLDDLIDLGVNAPAITIRDAADTMKGLFCYLYK